MNDRALSVRQVAEKFAVGEATVLQWIKSGELAAVNVGRSVRKLKPRWRVTHEALAIFELNRTASPPSPRAKCRKQTITGVIEFYR